MLWFDWSNMEMRPYNLAVLPILALGPRIQPIAQFGIIRGNSWFFLLEFPAGFPLLHVGEGGL